jgi:hypothetical protein
MKDNDYYVAADFIKLTLTTLERFSDESSSYYKPNKESRAYAKKVLTAWAEAATADMERYKTPEKAAKVSNLLKAIADFIG